MVITKELLQAEIAEFERSIAEAEAFVKQAQGAIGAYKMLIAKLDADEPVTQAQPEQ